MEKMDMRGKVYRTGQLLKKEDERMTENLEKPFTKCHNLYNVQSIHKRLFFC